MRVFPAVLMRLKSLRLLCYNSGPEHGILRKLGKAVEQPRLPLGELDAGVDM